MQSEIRTCQGCQRNFAIEESDFNFYNKFKVPPSTWCFDCRIQRRMAFRNERALYKRKCDVPGHAEEMISLYSPEKPLKVFDQKSWWGDSWEALDAGRDYDFSRPFFTQFKELIADVPWMALYNMNATNSEYCNMTTDNKNCYLVFGGDFNENCSYSTFNFRSKDCLDMYMSSECELSYEVIDSRSQYRCMFVHWSKDCTDSAFIDNCIGCTNCIGCVNLKNKSYCIFNRQYSKEEYEIKKKELDFSDATVLSRFKQEFEVFRKKFPIKYANIIRTVNATGNRISDAKNCDHCFDISGPAENLKDVFLTFNGYSDSYACSHGGHGVEECYEAAATFSGCQRLSNTYLMASSHDSSYSYNCSSSGNLFGCVGVRNKQYCIFNKQYSKEEYGILVEKIKKQMHDMPYVDSKGRVYTYGDFFPVELSPFAYNETVAQEYYPLSKEEALVRGFAWKDQEAKQYKIGISTEQLAEKLAEVTDDITKQIIECAHKGTCKESCTGAFKITPEELVFYRRLGVALPRFCSNCRHAQRLQRRAPNKLWSRSCSCSGSDSENKEYRNTTMHAHGMNRCQNKFETPYSPERLEIVYCEECYQAEVS
jgi:hypothetical protein